jgi:uncharacterized protein DUF3291
MTNWHIAQLNALADSFPGFVWRLEDESGNSTAIEYPGDPNRINNMSVWESVETLRAFTYDKDHVGFMRRRLDRFEKRDGPHFVMWWMPAGHVPTLQDPDRHLRLLADNGPSAEAFTFTLTFAPPA